MKSTAGFILLVGLLLSLQAPVRERAKKEELVSRLERDIPQLMAEGEVPGLAIALVRGGELVWHRGFGVSNAATRTPVTDETVFEAASLTKPVFAYAVLKLADAGKLDLDTPLSKYLPGNYEVGDDPRLHLITARHVLSHTPGFPNWRPRGSGQLKIHFTPGERFSYSGEGFVFLSRVVEHLTGEKTDAVMRRLVFEPLGMTSSSFVWQDRHQATKIFSHNWLGAPTAQGKPLNANAAASLSTTARDYGRFVVAILKGTGLKRETAQSMLTPQIRVGERPNSITSPVGRLSSHVSWGLGWGLQETSDGKSFWHWGDNGDNKSFVVAFEKQGAGVVVFTNSANGLSIMRDIVDRAAGGTHPALDWLNYESYRSPARVLLRNIRSSGAKTALAEYRERRKTRPASETINEDQMNRIGYRLLNELKRAEDAIEVFRLNLEDHPESANVYDSLAEAYMVAGNKELAIKHYQRAIELDPNNTNAREKLKQLQ